MTEPLKALLTNGVVVPGIWDALSAKLAENAGFSSVVLGGFQLEATLVGAPDLGLITPTEVISRAASVLEATDLPLIVDIDNGFGGTANIWRTVRGLETLGVAAVHMEDQTSPKRCPSLLTATPVEVHNREEAVLRVEAAIDARRTDDILIIARTDAPTWDEVVLRSNLFLEAGADIAMPMLMHVDGVPIWDLSPDAQMENFAKLAAQIDGPVFWNNRSVPLGHTASDLFSAGYSVVGMPIDALRASVAAIERLFASLARYGTAVPYYEENPGDRIDAKQFATEFLGLNDFIERESRFTRELRRNSR